MATVPRPVSLGAPGPLRVLALKRGTEAGRFVVEIAAPEGIVPDLFIEAPQPWFFEVAAAGGPADGQPMRIPVKVVERPSSSSGAELTLTVVAGRKAIEVRAPLDSKLLGP